MKILKKQIRPRVFLLRLQSQYELASMFLRFQEFYESKKFRGRVFTLEEYMDWYARTYGNFTYYQDWDGFNIPSEALQPFYEKRFDPLSQKEKKLLSLFRRERGAFYIIGLVSKKGAVDEAGLKHELAHALFYTMQDYRKAVLDLLRTYDTKALERRLSRLGYCRQVLKDEVHAWLLSQFQELEQPLRKGLAPLRRRLAKLYNQYSA